MGKITYETIKKNIDGKEIECDICQDGDKIYHNTNFKHLKSILKDKKLFPRCDIHWCSGAVSFSLDEKVIMGAGNIKLQFDGKKLKDKLVPMCYVSGRQDDYHAYWDAQEDSRAALQKEYREQIGDDALLVQDAFIDSKLGITTAVYKDECEWLSRAPIDIDNLEKITYYIGWKLKPFGHTETISCDSILGHKHAGVGSDWYENWEIKDDNKRIRPDIHYLIGKILRVREVANEHNIPFEVNSCFPILTDSTESMMSPKYIKLDKGNLEKLSSGVIPEYLQYEGAKQMLKNLVCKC